MRQECQLPKPLLGGRGGCLLGAHPTRAGDGEDQAEILWRLLTRTQIGLFPTTTAWGSAPRPLSILVGTGQYDELKVRLLAPLGGR
jgi:hypothetical protein